MARTARHSRRGGAAQRPAARPWAPPPAATGAGRGRPAPVLRLPPLRVLLAVVTLAAAALSCSSGSRQRILTTLFDGVHEPEDEAQATEAATGGAAAAAGDTSETPAAAPAAAAQWTFHPPFAAKECDSCHEDATAGEFSGAVELVAPRRELCTICHDTMGREELASEYAWVHPPVAAGECTGCHDPHVTAQPFMLRAPRGRALCVRCHVVGELSAASSAAHGDQTQCTRCHDPHAAAARASGPSDRGET